MTRSLRVNLNGAKALHSTCVAFQYLAICEHIISFSFKCLFTEHLVVLLGHIKVIEKAYVF